MSRAEWLGKCKVPRNSRKELMSGRLGHHGIEVGNTQTPPLNGAEGRSTGCIG